MIFVIITGFIFCFICFCFIIAELFSDPKNNSKIDDKDFIDDVDIKNMKERIKKELIKRD